MSKNTLDSVYAQMNDGNPAPPQPVSDQQPPVSKGNPAQSQDVSQVVPAVEGAQPEAPQQTDQQQAQQPFDWSSFGEGIDSPDALKEHFSARNTENEQLRGELEALKGKNPFSHELVAKLNEYVGMSDDPEKAIRQYLDLQARDFSSMSEDDLIKEMMMRETGLNSGQVDLLFNNQYSTKDEDPGEMPDDVEGYQQWLQRKSDIANRKQLAAVNKAAKANEARKYCQNLKEKTKVPEAFAKRQAAEAAQAQKKEAFLKSLPQMVKGASLDFGFGEGKKSFQFAIDADSMTEIMGVLPNVPGIENMDKAGLMNTVEVLALTQPQTKQRLLAAMWKHISSQEIKELHGDLGINGDVTPKPTGQRPNQGESAAYSAIYGQ